MIVQVNQDMKNLKLPRASWIKGTGKKFGKVL